MSDSSTEDQSWHIGVDSVVVGEENRRRSADFDMGAFTISIRRPILLSLACGARDERQAGGPVLGFGWSESLFLGRSGGRGRGLGSDGQTFYPFALCRDPISGHFPR